MDNTLNEKNYLNKQHFINQLLKKEKLSHGKMANNTITVPGFKSQLLKTKGQKRERNTFEMVESGCLNIYFFIKE